MKLFKNIKIWIIIALSVVVLGAVFTAVFGLNQTPDYKPAYEVTVSVDQDVEGSGALVKSTAEKYFAENGYKFSSYATQKVGDGARYIFKFNTAGNITESDLTEELQKALDNDATLGSKNLEASASYKATAVTSGINVWFIVLACALSLVVVFAVSFFTVKLASALTVICNAVVTMLIYVSVVAVTRIPALPNFVIAGAAGAILSVIMTFVIACNYKETLKTDPKADVKTLAYAGMEKGFLRICFIACAGLFAAIALSVTGSVYLLFTGVQIAVATLSAAVVSCVSTPALWTVLKNVKAKK